MCASSHTYPNKTIHTTVFVQNIWCPKSVTLQWVFHSLHLKTVVNKQNYQDLDSKSDFCQTWYWNVEVIFFFASKTLRPMLPKGAPSVLLKHKVWRTHDFPCLGVLWRILPIFSTYKKTFTCPPTSNAYSLHIFMSSPILNHLTLFSTFDTQV